MGRLICFLRNQDGNSAAEMALVTPFLLALLFGSVELGNLFMDEHALEKQIRDGARYASRLTVSDDYSCSADPSTVYQDGAAAADEIINVTKNGAVSGNTTARWTSYWNRNCDGKAQTVSVSIRCVDKDQIDTTASGNTGIYTSLPGTEIPVVKVSGAVKYRSVFALLGFDATNVCLQADSEAAVQGL
jgi:Flp pilus assembly protein TadG